MTDELEPQPGDGGPSRWWARRVELPGWVPAAVGWMAALTACIPIVYLAVKAWERRWMSDDGFINLRVVENLLDGHGPVFNLGERVEVYTSTLWIFILAVPGALGVGLEQAAVGLGAACAVSGVVLAALGGLRLIDPTLSWRTPGRLVEARLVPVGSILLVVLPPVWDFSTSGLETGLSFFWLGASYLAVAALVDRFERDAMSLRAVGGVGVWLGLAPLVRPELALFALALLAVICAMMVGRRRERGLWRPVVTLAICAGLIPVSYQIFRMGYFAALTPNTALAKEAFTSRWDQGWIFFDDFFGRYELVWPLVVTCLLGAAAAWSVARRRRYARAVVLLLPLVVGVVYCLQVIKIGGGFMHGRLFLPALFCLLMPVLVVPLRWAEARPRWWGPVCLGSLAMVMVWLSGSRLEEPPIMEPSEIANERRWYTLRAGHHNPVDIDDYRAHRFHRAARDDLDRAAAGCGGSLEAVRDGRADVCEPILAVLPHLGVLEPDLTTVALDPDAVDAHVVYVAPRNTIGIHGFVVGPTLHVADVHGLADPVASRLEVGASRHRPGHEKLMTSVWLTARFGQWEGDAMDPRVESARRALQCGELAQLLAAVREPLTVGRFMENLMLAPRLQALRIPRDAAAAERKFCTSTPD